MRFFSGYVLRTHFLYYHEKLYKF